MPKPMTPEEQARRQKKTKSVRNLAQQIDSLRQKVRKDLRSEDEGVRLTALAIALMDKTAERVGNPESASMGHFGVTGWKKKHITIDGSKVRLKYVGKSGVEQDKTFSDKTLAGMLKECVKNKGETILTQSNGQKIQSERVNRYLSDFDITAKDIRGYRANDLLVKMLKARKTPSDPKERKKAFREAIKEVAAAVGHQQATLKKHYLLPYVEENYVKNGKVKEVKNASLSPIIDKVAIDVVLTDYARSMIPVVKRAYELCFGQIRPIRFYVRSTMDLPDGKAGSFTHPSMQEPIGMLTIATDVFLDGEWKEVLVHEMIHAAIGNEDGEHGEKFDILAEVIGLPKEFRN